MGRGEGSKALTAKDLLYGSRPRGQGPAPQSPSPAEAWPRFYNSLLNQLSHDQYIVNHQSVQIEDQESGQTVSHLIFDINQQDGTAVRLIPTNEDGRLGVALYSVKQNDETFIHRHVLEQNPRFNSLSVYGFEQFLVDHAEEIGLDYIEINVDPKHVDNYLNSDQDYQFVGSYWEEKHNLDNAKRGAYNMIETYRLDQSTIAAAHLSDQDKSKQRAELKQIDIAIDNVTLSDPPSSVFRALAQSQAGRDAIAWAGGIGLRRDLTEPPLV